MSENKVGTYRFVAEPFHCDFSGKLTMSVLGNHLLNCAGFHAADRGFGIATLNENHYTWVLSRLAVELENMPCQYEGFSIQTWVENVYRLFTDRNFAILDKEGKTVGYARSVWAMISMETRKPADLLTLHGGSIIDYVCDKKCPISKPGRIKVTEKAPVSEYQTRYSDIDINGHVNSIKYIEHILDLFPIEFFKEKRIKRFEMAYVAESYYRELKEVRRLYKSIGSLGSGNHFIELDKDESDLYYLVVHTGSRNLGKQVADIYQKLAVKCQSGWDKLMVEKNRIIEEYKQAGRKSELQDVIRNLHNSFKTCKLTIPQDLCYLQG